MSDSTSVNIMPGWVGLLGVILVVLKIFHYIDWPWWLVLMPFWIGLAVLLAILLIFLTGVGGYIGITAWLERRKLSKYRDIRY